MKEGQERPEPRDVVPRDDVHVGVNRCPFCHDDVDATDRAALVCQGCLARHHGACWSEAGRCGACKGTTPLAVARPVAREPEGRVAVVAPQSASSAAVVVGVVFVVAVALLLLFSATLLVAGREQAVAAPPVVMAPPPPRAAPTTVAAVAEDPRPSGMRSGGTTVRAPATVLLWDGEQRRAITIRGVGERLFPEYDIHVVEQGRFVRLGQGSGSFSVGGGWSYGYLHVQPFSLGFTVDARTGELTVFRVGPVRLCVTDASPTDVDPADPRFEYE
jgi:hypothetical protein